MDSSPQYKKLANESEYIQRLWEPEIGDFWGCNCGSCLDSVRSWVLELPDILSIRPEEEWDNYYRTVKESTHVSRDAGFGAFWFQYKESTERGYVWLPRLDQLIDIIKTHPGDLHLVPGESDFYSTKNIFFILERFIKRQIYLIQEFNVSVEYAMLSWIIKRQEFANA